MKLYGGTQGSVLQFTADALGPLPEGLRNLDTPDAVVGLHLIAGPVEHELHVFMPIELLGVRPQELDDLLHPGWINRRHRTCAILRRTGV